MSYVLTTCFPTAESLRPAEVAAGIAMRVNCALRLVHAYTVPFVIGEFPAPVVAPDDLRVVAEAQLETAEESLLKLFLDLRVESSLSYGILDDVLSEAIDAESPLLVVLANDLAEDSEAALGTDTANAMSDIPVPVMAVPPRSMDSPLSHLCLALSPQSLADSEPLTGIGLLQQRLGFRVSVVSVSDGVPDGEEAAEFESPLRVQLSALGATFTTIPAGGVPLSEVLDAFITSQGADCVGILKQERGFFSALFHKSQTEALLKITSLPVISFHAGAVEVDI